MMQVRLLEIAQTELDESIDYYNSESAGLGDEFLVEVLLVLDRIKNFPQAWHRLRISPAAVNCVVSLTESYTRHWIQRFLSLQLPIYIETPNTGKIE